MPRLSATLVFGILSIVLIAIALPGVSWAQRPVLPDSLFVPACDMGHTMPVDTAAVTFVARPGMDDNGWRVRGRSYKRARAVAEILAQYFNPPVTLAPLQPRTWYRGKDRQRSLSESVPGLSADLKVWLDWTGRMTGVEWDVASRSPELANAVLRALHAADSAMAFVKLRKPANVPILLALAAVEAPADDDQPLMPLRVTYYPMEQPVQIRDMPEPRYPPGLQEARVEGRVEVQYLVDTSGHAVPATLWVVSATDDGFIPAASEAVLGGTFHPAHGHGCRLGMVVQQVVWFKFSPSYNTLPAGTGTGRFPPDTGR